MPLTQEPKLLSVFYWFAFAKALFTCHIVQLSK
jgi:hypothetical protein